MTPRAPRLVPLALGALALLGLALAVPLGLAGTAKSASPLPASVRVGLFAADRSGNPVAELAGSALGPDGAFSLSLPEAAPPERAVSSLSPEGLDWPGLVGQVALSAPTRAAELRLRAYTDADGSRSYGPGDSLWDTVVTRGARGGLVVVWAERRVRVTAERGFDLTLEPGWNLVLIEVGKAVSASRAGRADGLQLDLFRR